MNKVIAPLNPGMNGPEVVNLQDVLLFLLIRKLIRFFETHEIPTEELLQTLTEGLKRERIEAVFSDATTKLIQYFQIQNGLGDQLQGVVDEKTAERLNQILQENSPMDSEPNQVVSRRITLQDGKPAEQVKV